LALPIDQQSTFEPDGDGHSKYIYARMNGSNRRARVGKVILRNDAIGHVAFLLIAWATTILAMVTVEVRPLELFLGWLASYLFVLTVLCILFEGVINDVRSKAILTSCTCSRKTESY